jgi:hypothetical protein
MVDRHVQLVLLTNLRESYPAFVPLKSFFHNVVDALPSEAFDKNEEFEQSFLFNLNYLVGHKLVTRPEPIYSRYFDHTETPNAYRITSKGIDFLEDDGGLSAILNTVTVKFDVENVRSLVEAGLLRTNVPEEKQGALRKAIKEAPGTVLQTAVSKMVEKGMSDPVGTAKAVAGLFGISW